MLRKEKDLNEQQHVQMPPRPRIPASNTYSSGKVINIGVLLLLTAMLLALLWWGGMAFLNQLDPSARGETSGSVLALVLGIPLVCLIGFTGLLSLILILIGVGRAFKERTTNT
jgi:hypothetical protein